MKDVESEFLLKEYDTLWAYYKFILDARDKVFDFQFKTIAALAVVAPLLAFVADRTQLPEQVAISIIGVSCLLVGSVGVCFYLYYFLETKNMRRYIVAWSVIQEFIRKRCPDLSDVIILDKIRMKGFLLGVGIFRSAFFIITNAALLVASALLIAEPLRKCANLFSVSAFVILVLAQIYCAKIILSETKTWEADFKKKLAMPSGQEAESKQ